MTATNMVMPKWRRTQVHEHLYHYLAFVPADGTFKNICNLYQLLVHLTGICYEQTEEKVRHIRQHPDVGGKCKRQLEQTNQTI